MNEYYYYKITASMLFCTSMLCESNIKAIICIVCMVIYMVICLIIAEKNKGGMI